MLSYNKLRLAAAFLKGKRLQHLLGSALDYRRSLLSKKVVMKHYPPAVMIEPTNICNLKCPLCPSGNGTLKRERGMMDLNGFLKIVDQIHHHTAMLILWNQGEPYLNPDFNKMVAYAAQKKLYTMTSTNASLALDHDAIVRSGLDRIIISMDGISEETYNSYRINGDFTLVLDNMQKLIDAKKRLNSKTPFIVWQYIVMRQNEHEIPAVRRKARELGVDSLEFKTVQIYKPEDLIFLPTDHKLSRYSAEGQDFELATQLLNRCRRLWTQPVINWDGELSICCYDKDVIFKIGNVYDLDFYDLWTSDKMNKIRARILQDRQSIEICRNCGEGIIQKLKL
ncbi:MAG: radical SAM/SPASM domain-containing protein [Candidatus Cloacimonadaceae bacterium]|jgi:MoaA/NifB/PqqE/SkfB family radical SAM enzyme|nr:SPASM domain-containing protein [Candidatus Cloacimonadota bacterium]MDY0127037.1 radical SAM/SPASM domain-containing protein [Candidatus Cloacimonadaceae bacterium]MCB5254109.1 SPASM domain-containing protein [Candidatus Cloacimonadota bacterium]MCK9177696.1 SPASM domain-containing protein [Candidatus Cloacimonadota bacterium]MCK9241669.1 SPASM domain-containing protein [Candidatus Cloacimonadota bacterium]